MEPLWKRNRTRLHLELLWMRDKDYVLTPLSSNNTCVGAAQHEHRQSLT
jgi:hypothetical protein